MQGKSGINGQVYSGFSVLEASRSLVLGGVSMRISFFMPGPVEIFIPTPSLPGKQGGGDHYNYFDN